MKSPSFLFVFCYFILSLILTDQVTAQTKPTTAAYYPQINVNFRDPFDPSIWLRWVDDSNKWQCAKINMIKVNMSQSLQGAWQNIDDYLTPLTMDAQNYKYRYGCATNLPDILIPGLAVNPTQHFYEKKVGLVKLGQTLVSASSDAEGFEATKAFDIEPTGQTYWQTPGDVPLPHEIIGKLNRPYLISAFGYLPRQDASKNIIRDFEIWLSNDNDYWVLAAKSLITSIDTNEKIIRTQPTEAQFVKWVALSTQDFSTGVIAATALNVYGLPIRSIKRPTQ